MRWNLLSLLKNRIKYCFQSPKHEEQIKTLYETRDYLDAYSAHTDIRVESDLHQAVGGKWEEIGKLQFDFLVNQGLQPYHRLLDIGCGTLRGGKHFIRYLNVRNYSGIDISPKAVECGKQLVEQDGLFEKHPRLMVSRNKDLKFEEFEGEVFDYLLAQSVFTHLKPVHIEECFQHIGQIMNQDSVFFFTFKEALKFKHTALKDFCYPFSFFQSLAAQYGFDINNCSEDYKHPRGQHMVKISKRKITQG